MVAAPDDRDLSNKEKEHTHPVFCLDNNFLICQVYSYLILFTVECICLHKDALAAYVGSITKMTFLFVKLFSYKRAVIFFNLYESRRN